MASFRLISAVALIATATAADQKYCTGIKACGCTVVNSTISYCTKNSEKMYLHSIKTERITGIKEGAFAFLAKVKELHLSGNNITKIEKRSFEGLAKLEYLFLADNNM